MTKPWAWHLTMELSAGTLPLLAARLPFQMAESSRTLCNRFFLPGALLSPALHRVPIAVISWELSSSLSGNSPNTRHLLSPAPGCVTPVAGDRLSGVGWSSADTPGARLVCSGMYFPTSALTAWISWPPPRSLCRVHLLSQALKGRRNLGNCKAAVEKA